MADLIDRARLKRRIREEPTDGMYTEEILEAIDEQPAVDPLFRLRLKYGWHDAAKLLPNHSRHVLVWTNRGEFRAYYDHVHDCWRTTRDGLRITHWRERCGPEDWPAAE